MGERAGRWVAGGLVLVLLALVGATAWVVIAGRDEVDEELTAAQQDVAGAARAEAVAFLTVDHRDMDPLIDAVLDGATGDFAEQYASQPYYRSRCYNWWTNAKA